MSNWGQCFHQQINEPHSRSKSTEVKGDKHYQVEATPVPNPNLH